MTELCYVYVCHYTREINLVSIDKDVLIES